MDSEIPPPSPFFQFLPFLLLAAHVFLSWQVGRYWRNSRGRSFRAGFLVSLFFSPLLGLGVGAMLQANTHALRHQKLADGSKKKCPHCAELIQAEARICRWCQREQV